MLLRRANKVVTRCVPYKTFNKIIYRTYSINTTIRNLKLSGSYNNPNLKRDVGLALIGSTSILLLSYSYLTQRPIVLDSINSVRDYSTKTNGKMSKSNDSISLLTDDEINKKLRNIQESYFVNRSKGISRFDVAQLPSNHPIEDSHIEQIITVPVKDSQDEDLYFFGIFDGHSGPFTSAKLSKDLVKYVAKELNPLFTNDGTKIDINSSAFDSAISSAFIKLDNDIILESFRRLFKSPSQENMIGVLPAISGSCALLSVYNSMNSTLKVAVAGDSRTLIGGIDDNGKWFVKALSIDQTGDNMGEVERIRSEHPNEPNVIRRGRVLGCLQPSRAFGDYRYKLNEVDGKKLSELPDHVKIYFRSEPKGFMTPPYVTVKPEITTTKINSNIKFMVMGSDGLFELLTNEEIAGLVVKWKEYYMSENANTRNKPPTLGKLPSIDDVSEDKTSQRPAFRYKQNENAATSNYLLDDSNVATHLIRNALSAGGQKEYVSTLTSIPSPMSRRYRDDLTVTVAFFGDSQDTDGSLTINQEATSPPKPKL